ncbi:MAG: hypothetical protein LBU73_03210 [Helicobacteraceae bacterium]|jgi:antitoxin component YwqK of YwqJK toxin-antitoxin module|nr:hypothetical protein [Helicobacteraceae bacterium]
MKRILIAILLATACQSADTDYKVYIVDETARLDEEGKKCMDMKGNLLPGKAELRWVMFDVETFGTRCIDGEAIEERGYYESGELLYIEPQKNGKAEGVKRFFYESGKLWYETPFKNELKDGTQKRYYKNGKLAWEVAWKNDILDGEMKVYRENGTIWATFTYKNGNVISSVCYETNGEKRPFTEAKLENWYDDFEVTCY